MKNIFLGLVIFVLLSGCDGMFGIDNVQRHVSPDGRYEAVVFRGGAGATTRFSFHLTILKTNGKLKNSPGNTYVSYSEFEVEWKDDNTL